MDHERQTPASSKNIRLRRFGYNRPIGMIRSCHAGLVSLCFRAVHVRSAPRQTQGNSRADTVFAGLAPDSAAMRTHNLAAQVQPDSRAAHAVHGISLEMLDAKELLKDPLAAFGRNSWADVRDRNLQHGRRGRSGILPGRDRHAHFPPLRRIFQGVDENVGQNAGQARRIALDHRWREIGHEFEIDARIVESRLQPGEHLAKIMHRSTGARFKTN